MELDEVSQPDNTTGDGNQPIKLKPGQTSRQSSSTSFLTTALNWFAYLIISMGREIIDKEEKGGIE